jgi:alpha-beta hydrolase superfamily lysophospholipase
MIQEFEGHLPVFLMGHSLGGLIVLNYALYYPHGIKAIIASGPALVQPNISPFLLFLSRALSKIWPSFSVDTKLAVDALSRDPEVVKAYQEDPLVHSKASARLGTEFTCAMKWTLTQSANFSLPLMIIHGGSDQLVPAKGSYDFYEKMTIEDREIHIYEGGFHEPHNDIDKIKVLKDMEQWIQKHI